MFSEKSSSFIRFNLEQLQTILRQVKVLVVTHGTKISIFASFLFCVGIVGWMVEHALLREARALFAELTPAYRPERPAIYGSFVAYVLIWMAVVGFAGMVGLWRVFPGLSSSLERLADKLCGATLTAALILSIVITPELSRICFLATAVLMMLRIICGGTQIVMPPRTSIVVRWLMALSAVTLTLVVVGQAWFPLRLPNDYLETPERILIPAGQSAKSTSLSRQDAIDCIARAKGMHDVDLQGREKKLTPTQVDAIDMVARAFVDTTGSRNTLTDSLKRQVSEAMSLPDCPVEMDILDASALADQLRATGGWASPPGRVFYHHSYLFVPAVHLIRHGLDAPIPFLYGLGNTAFHALLISDSPTLTRYFATFPIAQLLGILIIVLGVWIVSRSALVIPLAGSLALISLISIGYEPLSLSADFSPLRYAGIALQIISIFWLFRSGARRLLGTAVLSLVLVLSLIWNREFGVIGGIGQGLALLFARSSVPERGVISGGWRTIGQLAVLGVSAIISLIWLRSLSAGFAENINVGIFGVPFLPTLSREAFLWFCTAVTIGGISLTAAAHRFQDQAERGARLCLVPIFGFLMIKYVFCASPIHLLYTLSFVVPFTLAFFDWRRGIDRASNTTAVLRNVTGFAMLALAAVALVNGIRYTNAADTRDARMVRPFELHAWSALGESFRTPTSASAIEQRVGAIKAELRPDDAALFLSPFDHLMAFYATPAHYCGHFDNVTNLVTFGMIEEAAACIEQAPHALVVYDAAVETECPSGLAASYIDQTQCQLKRELMLNMRSLMVRLSPRLQRVAQRGSLTFYRTASR